MIILIVDCILSVGGKTVIPVPYIFYDYMAYMDYIDGIFKKKIYFRYCIPMMLSWCTECKCHKPLKCCSFVSVSLSCLI